MLRNLVLGLWSGTLALSPILAAADDWLPIDPQELAMTSEAKAPNAPALYLYRQVDRDDNLPFENVYNRIKILTEEGRKYADIQIPFDKRNENVRSIRARTIRPDGSIAEFDGEIYENLILQTRGVKVLAKTFTLTDVQVGSIIEYRYRHDLRRGYVFDSHWILSEQLFTKYAKFSLIPSEYFRVRYSWPIGLPAGTEPPANVSGKIRLEARDVPAFLTEEYMPPEDQLKYRVDFVYMDGSNTEREPAPFWKKYGKSAYGKADDFIDKPGVMRDAVATIVSSSDSPEAKLRKLYARAQQVRNLSFERSKTEEEAKREGIKDVKNVADVWKRGYGDGDEVNLLFLGLARAAGFDAHSVMVSTRDRYFFDDRIMNPWHLNTMVVQVKLEGKDWYLDPGTALAPFGTLPWGETGVRGLRLDKDGGTWLSTPMPAADDSRIVRKANLKLSTSGTLEGTLTVTYTGLEALRRRIYKRNEDDADRTKYLEDEVDGDIPTGIDVKLTNKPDWAGSEAPLVAEYELTVPGWASSAGQRALLTMGLFGEGEKGTFKQATRVHPLYFSYPYKSEDDISIELPSGWQTTSIPQPFVSDQKVITFRTSAEHDGQTLRIKRELMSTLVILNVKYYQQLRDFFQAVRTHDEQQIVIAPAKAAPDKVAPGKATGKSAVAPSSSNKPTSGR